MSPEDESRLAPHAFRVVAGRARPCQGTTASAASLLARKDPTLTKVVVVAAAAMMTAAAIPQVPSTEAQCPQHPNAAAIVRRTVATRLGRTREAAPIPPATRLRECVPALLSLALVLHARDEDDRRAPV